LSQPEKAHASAINLSALLKTDVYATFDAAIVVMAMLMSGKTEKVQQVARQRLLLRHRGENRTPARVSGLPLRAEW
jgi:hypothetical protein